VPDRSQYCFACEAVLPLVSFATDRNRHNGKRITCRICDHAARAVRDQQRRARLKLQLAA
jgi:RNase P subunit RPR2